MYPRISDFLNDILGTNMVLPIQTFGFFVAIAFLVAYFVIQKEYLRRQAIGQFKRREEQVKTGGGNLTDLILNVLMFAFIGLKVGLLLEDYSYYAAHTQELLIPVWKGSWIGALLLGGITAFLKGRVYWQKKDEPVKLVSQTTGLPEDLGTMFTMAFVFGILGAKLFHAFEYWSDFVKDPVGMLASFDGLTFYGGLLCAAIAIIFYVRNKKHDILAVADATTPVLLLSYGIGRLGCHFSGDGDWGIVNPSPNPGLPSWLWSYTYPNNVVGDGTVKIPGCVGEHCMELAEGVYPTSVYEAAMGIGLFFVLWAFRKKNPFLGQLSGLYLIFNGLERFLIEKIRVNVKTDFLGMQLTQAEIISFTLMLLGGILFALSTFYWKKPNTESTVVKN